jgi:hypothetical protein
MQSADSIRKPFPAIVALSAGVASFLIMADLLQRPGGCVGLGSGTAAANVKFNSLSALGLVFGYVDIRRRWHPSAALTNRTRRAGRRGRFMISICQGQTEMPS